ncbi:MAG: PhnD/SsuA/transferrin family substrate-binding protein [Deltaproteobacteria bacterium]|nr:PhnD/SsuA/transferrin family substrate-binding protein [Deltaproteobacteria bacterium]
MAKPLTFGLVEPPRKADDEGAEPGSAFEALATWLRENTELDLERKTWPTYRALGESVREGKSDLAWLPPVVYAWLAEGVSPLGSIARGEGSGYASALVVLASSKLEALGDLKGKRAGWIDPLSAAGYVVPRIEMLRQKVDPRTTFATETFYGGHREALMALESGGCDVVATFDGAWTLVGGLDVRVLAKFAPIPSDVIAARRNLPPSDYERAIAALRRAASEESVRSLVKKVFGGDKLREGIEPGHDKLRTDFESATANGLFD